MDKLRLAMAEKDVAEMTMIGAYRTMSQQVDLVADIGLLIYPGCQLAAIYGLTDLFRIAGEWTGEDTAGHPRFALAGG